MKLPIISVQNEKGKTHDGFLLAEIMISFSLMTLFFVSALTLSGTMKKLEIVTKEQLVQLKNSFVEMNYFAENKSFSSIENVEIKQYGNNSEEIIIKPLTLFSSNYDKAWGRDSCDARIDFDSKKVALHRNGTDLGGGNISTDIEMRNKIAYLTADSSTASAADFFVVDMNNPDDPHIISSLHTGPGLGALEVVGPYVFAANLGTTNHLQIIDIHDRANPVLLSRYKLIPPEASSTLPFASSIFYYDKKIFLGTQKWDGNEFSIIDVANPSIPVYLGGYNTDTLISDIYVVENLAYLANSNEHQMSVLDMSNPEQIVEISTFSPSGYQTQEGKVLSYFEGKLSFGRTTGGFNILSNHEVFLFGTTSQVVSENSHDIPGGVYGILFRPPFVYLATRSPGHEFQVWDEKLSEKVFELPLGFFPQAFVCDRGDFYFATGDQYGIAVLLNNN